MLSDWPPDYVSVFKQRQSRIKKMRENPQLIAQSKIYYKTRPVEFINHWCATYDPRNSGTDKPAVMPFCMFPKQNELTLFLYAMVKGQESGLIEKARDMGATWVCCAFSLWLWLFWSGASIGWGSRKEQLVDKLGDPDSIFEKIRILVKYLPKEFWPIGFDPSSMMGFMKIVNPENGSTITGEGGDNIGRGGRKLIYFKDESAHYVRPEKIEAALGDTTRTQIDISSVNGLGNVFHRRRESGAEWLGGDAIPGKTNVFVMDWRDHPHKDQEWFDKRKQKAIDDGLLHVFAQEVERNYAASVIGIIIKPEWVDSAIDAHLKLDFDDSGSWCAGLDIADEGLDTNALSKRKGVVLKSISEWGARDTGITARNAIIECENLGEIDVQYDSIGVGAGVKSEANRIADDDDASENIKKIRFVPWNAAESPKDKDEPVIKGDKDSPLNGDYFQNIKAQGWWQLSRRFEKTHKALVEGVKYPSDELISLDSSSINQAMLRKLQKELSQATWTKSGTLKNMVNKTPEGTKSPNLADSVMMNYWPVGKPKFTYKNL